MSHRSVHRSSPDLDRPNMSIQASTKPDLNLVLCGSDAALKASVLKCFMGEKTLSMSRQTFSSVCVMEEEKIHGRQISVVKLPALTRLSEEEVMRQTLSCVSLCQPGVHVFLLIVPDAPLTDEDKAEIEKIRKIFDSREHLILLFTTDLTVGTLVTDSIKSRPESQRLISLCGGRYRVMGLKEPENSRQIPELLEYIEKMKTEPYSLQMYVKAQENRARHELEEQHKKELKRMENENKELKQKIQPEENKRDQSPPGNRPNSHTSVMESNAHLNLILLGTAQSGKSASGNTILGRKAFVTNESPSSVTQDVAVVSGNIFGIPVTVHDTPRLCESQINENQMPLQYKSIFQSCESGPCVFLLVIKADSFTAEERRTVEKIEGFLGPNRLNKTWILFTRGDELDRGNTTIKESLERNEALKTLEKYDQRYHVFNNMKKRGSSDQARLLLAKIIHTSCLVNASDGGMLPRRITTVTTFTRDLDVINRSSRRIVLLGKTGFGKSASGNTILGQNVFKSEVEFNSITPQCSVNHATFSGRSVSVVDTPGLFDTQDEENTDEQVKKEIARSVYMSSPGPHAFLIVFRVIDRFTEHEQQILQMIEMMFGQEALKYSIILFTWGDQLKEKSIEDLIKGNSRMRHLVQQCGDRYHVFNNRDQRNRDQVTDLLEKIDTMIEKNRGGYYSNQMYEDALRYRQREEEKRRKREEERRKQQEEKERVRLQKIRSEAQRLEAERQREDEWRKQQESRAQSNPEFEEFYRQYERRFSFSAFISGSTHTGIGAVVGGILGAALGIIAGPPGAVVGGVAGAAVGAAVGTMYSIFNE